MAEGQKDYFHEWWDLWTSQRADVAEMGSREKQESGSIVENGETQTTPSAPTPFGNS